MLPDSFENWLESNPESAIGEARWKQARDLCNQHVLSTLGVGLNDLADTPEINSMVECIEADLANGDKPCFDEFDADWLMDASE